jgi:hypothetical protein
LKEGCDRSGLGAWLGDPSIGLAGLVYADEWFASVHGVIICCYGGWL